MLGGLIVDVPWQEVYYRFATVGAVAGMVSCLVSVLLFLRTRPDRIKTRVEEAIKPLLERIEKVEREQEDSEKQVKEQIKQLDDDLSRRMRASAEETAKLRQEAQVRHEQLSVHLARISAQLEHSIGRKELDTLHHRVTETSKNVAEVNGHLEQLSTLVNSINDYLREKGR